MRILMTYFSQTGNTEKIAHAIGEVRSMYMSPHFF